MKNKKKIIFIIVPVLIVLALVIFYFPKSTPDVYENSSDVLRFVDGKTVTFGNYKLVEKTYDEHDTYTQSKVFTLYRNDKLIKDWRYVNSKNDPDRMQLYLVWTAKASNPLPEHCLSMQGNDPDIEDTGENKGQTRLSFDNEGRIRLWHWDVEGSRLTGFRVEKTGILLKGRDVTFSDRDGNACGAVEYVMAEYKDSFLGPIRAGRSKVVISDDYSWAYRNGRYYSLRETGSIATAVGVPVFWDDLYK